MAINNTSSSFFSEYGWHIATGSSCTTAIAAIAIGILSILAQYQFPLGPFNVLGNMGTIGGGIHVGMGLAIPLVLLGIYLYKRNQTSDNSSQTPSFSPPHQNTLARNPLPSPAQVPAVPLTELSKLTPKQNDFDQIFAPFKQSETYDCDERKKEIETVLHASSTYIVNPTLVAIPQTQVDISRSEKIIRELRGFDILERDGTTWESDAVLMRGICLQENFDTKKEFSTSMTNIINQTFSEGMKPNGYLYNDDDQGGSTFRDELVITENRHNWLVSTTFSLPMACEYATRNGEGSVGLIFLIHASQEGMKNDLFGVNLSGGGKKSVGDGQKEMAFVNVPPQYIIGAIPVFNYRDSWGVSEWYLYKDHFISNPLFASKVTTINQLESLGLESAVMEKLSRSKYSKIVADGPFSSPKHEEACRLDRAHLGLN